MTDTTQAKIFHNLNDALTRIENILQVGVAQATDGKLLFRILVPIQIAEIAKYSYCIKVNRR